MALALILAATSAARAEHTSLVVVAPLGELGISRTEAGKVQRWLQAAITQVPAQRLLSSTRVARFMRGRIDCEASLVCLGGAARAAGAQLIVGGDVGQLGGGYIVYLKLVSSGGQQLRSLSGVLDPKAGLRAAARALAYQLLAPHRYTGTLALKVDVPNSWIYVDGRRVAKSPTPALSLTVGTHALRVTNEAYRDFVRFVRVDFEQQHSVEARLDPVPVASRRMQLASGVRVLADHELPWYRRWWAVASVGAVVVAATTVVVALIPKSVTADREVSVSRP